MRDQMNGPVPTLVSFLLCDQVLDDRLTGKKSAIGLFNAVMVPSIPLRLSQIVVMASMTEIAASTTVELRLVRDADNNPILRTQGLVDAPDPLATVELVFNVQGITIPTAGQYAFELWSQGELLGRRRFQVLLSGSSKEA